MLVRSCALIVGASCFAALSAAHGPSCNGKSCVDDQIHLLQTRKHEHKDSIAEASGPEEPNPPDFGSNVFILEEGSAPQDIANALDSIFKNGVSWDNDAQFGKHRTAVLLKPGNHELDIDLPYYFSVNGLGSSPHETEVRPGPRNVGLRVTQQGSLPDTNTFWRSIENVRIAMDRVEWHVSQAAPMRSVIVDGDLVLSGGFGDWTSGGCLANSQIGRNLVTGTQQQWYTRSTRMMPYQRASTVGSYVCVGCEHPNGYPYSSSYDFSHNQKDQAGHSGVSYTQAPAVFAEKPFVFFDASSGKYKLRIPEVLSNHWGPDWLSGSTVDFSKVFVTKNDTTAMEINSKIASGLHVLFTPAVYLLEEPIRVNVPNIVLLGIGFATLIPKPFDGFKGRAVIEIGNVDGVRLAGLLVQAGPQASADYTDAVESLVQWGKRHPYYEGNKANPGFIYDLVGRVGGPDQAPVGVRQMVEINSGWVIGDDLWLWKADHCVASSGALCIPQRYVSHSLVVNGGDVHMYGLMAEHTNDDIVVWNGENGLTMFYQSEFKYTMGEAKKPETWQHVGHSCSYRVNAVNHTAIGFGIYTVVYAPDSDNDAVAAMAPVVQQGGMSGIAVKSKSTYIWGFKDISAAVWNGKWPYDSKQTCKAWGDADRKCLDRDVLYLNW